MIPLAVGVLLGDFLARMFWAYEMDRTIKQINREARKRGGELW